MRLVIISDTHTLHEQLGELSGDVLIHCGDMCNGFLPDRRDIERMDDWFLRQEFDLILCTGGNHDLIAEEWHHRGATVFQNATYLVDEAIEFQGVKFYAAPWIPKLDGWAYFQADDELSEKWERIPDDTNVLITHTPPFRILDRNPANKPQGCSFLRSRLEELESLRLHAFGHIHESYGVHDVGDVKFVNAALQRAKVLREPVVVEL